ncbi:tRNA U34 5-methylaminomethyl-2-thiouridine-forming methyltransferase MnmC [Balnearium lithotrophicum]|uniref:tRNA U34 5-methylaminomethyl-2-thiouridine-forming methyltransferase MnmC n=1 Tax=Balnearium lithotrophicum TaxID=223788 RepID=A0A521B722_9BACT|nr:MnmC family methyltransferase [Balnearium lithotrophicum]SMO42865.1 tRNA U34 5-methylaminomethyl-2-thiouridine-forming methyltransferase MnmC [Balnearium lithotrophicum]
MNREIRTEDGSVTLFSERFNEPYHSVTAGAFTEAVEKFCRPTRVRERARRGRVNLLDVCFGLGYNTVAFLEEVFSENPRAEVRVVGVEFDLSVIKRSLSINWGSYEKWKWVLREILKNRACEGDTLTLNLCTPKIKIEVYITEGRNFLKKFSKNFEKFADAVFHDPFSPKVNPELWTFEFFKEIRKAIKEDGILATYSSSTAVRRALHMAGFGVVEGVAVGRKSKSTVASPSFKTDSEILKKFRFESSIPLRDPKLSDPSELIKSRREGCIWVLRRKLGLEVIY